VHSARILLHLTGYGKAHVTFYANHRARVMRLESHILITIAKSRFCPRRHNPDSTLATP
jgi:hypothetical protein